MSSDLEREVREVREVRLDNGLRVLLRPLRTVPVVSVWCWYHVGSKNEGPGLTGVSHFVEHMNFKGTETISREELKVWIERAGGTWNGYTWLDQTTYFETLAAEELDLALRIEAERMAACTYRQDEFDSERTVVLSELQGNSNDPGYLLDIDVTAAALRMHPYRWPTIGWQSDLEAMTRDDLWSHYRRYYVPGNAVLVVAGDFDLAEAIDRVEARFGAIAPGTAPAHSPIVEPEQHGERRVVLEQPGTTAYLQVAYRAPAFSDPDFAPLLLADAVLSGGKGINLWSGGLGRSARTTSPLYQDLVETELVVAIGSALLPTEEPYLFELSATLRDGVAHRDAEAALFGAIERLRTDAPGDATMDKARNQVLSALAFESEKITEIGHQLGFYATIGGLEKAEAFAAEVAAVEPEAVRAAAERWLRPQDRTVGWFQPLSAS